MPACHALRRRGGLLRAGVQERGVRRSPPNHAFARSRGLQRRLRRSKSADAVPRVPSATPKMRSLRSQATPKSSWQRLGSSIQKYAVAS
eukprot:4091077-Prymnesium_polylepis.1